MVGMTRIDASMRLEDAFADQGIAIPDLGNLIAAIADSPIHYMQYAIIDESITDIDGNKIDWRVSKAEDDYGYDLRSRVNRIIPPNKTQVVPTNTIFQLPPGIRMDIRGRSGMNSRGHFTILGLIDYGYRNEIGAVIFNSSQEPFEIYTGDRVAQFVLSKAVDCFLDKVPSAQIETDTDRGLKGFGSSGVK